MLIEREHNFTQDQLDEIAHNLAIKIGTDDARGLVSFDHHTTRHEWKVLSESSPLRVVLENYALGVNARAYPPQLNSFAESYLNALLLVAGHDRAFTHRVLPPIGYASGVIFFPIVGKVEQIHYDELPDAQRRYLRDVAASHELRNWQVLDTIEVAILHGDRYIISPFDDRPETLARLVPSHP